MSVNLDGSLQAGAAQAFAQAPRRAVHRGSCQACGAVHKLPRGALAKHGYTVAGYMFHGTCPGSDEQPFELTCALVEAFIGRTQAEMRALAAHAHQLDQPATEAVAWVHVYRPFTSQARNGGGYAWLNAAIKQVDAHRLLYTDEQGKDVTYPYSLRFTGLFDACTTLNRQYRERVVLREIARAQRYILWQQRRVASWALAPLLPLDPDHAPEQVSFFDLDVDHPVSTA